MELVVVILYILGAVLTARHGAYQTKLYNDGRDFYGFTLEPKVYSAAEYQRMRNESRRAPRGVQDLGDYRKIAAAAAFFPVYWFLALVSAIGDLVIFSVKKTPGEVERDRREQQAELDRLYRETERLRREQDG